MRSKTVCSPRFSKSTHVTRPNNVILCLSLSSRSRGDPVCSTQVDFRCPPGRLLPFRKMTGPSCFGNGPLSQFPTLQVHERRPYAELIYLCPWPEPGQLGTSMFPEGLRGHTADRGRPRARSGIAGSRGSRDCYLRGEPKPPYGTSGEEQRRRKKGVPRGGETTLLTPGALMHLNLMTFRPLSQGTCSLSLSYSVWVEILSLPNEKVKFFRVSLETSSLRATVIETPLQDTCRTW